MFYQKELAALEHSGLLRRRKIHDSALLDFASNDYLGLSFKPKLLKKALKLASQKSLSAPRASMLVNGYSKLHQRLETKLARLNGFESCTLFGSGFLANIALFEALARKNDLLFVDEGYHASGILATRLQDLRAIFFKHNDAGDLRAKISESRANLAQDSRLIIAIEGIYSMSGEAACFEFAKIALEQNAILIVDEAHSSGVLGENLLGFFDFYKNDLARLLREFAPKIAAAPPTATLSATATAAEKERDFSQDSAEQDSLEDSPKDSLQDSPRDSKTTNPALKNTQNPPQDSQTPKDSPDSRESVFCESGLQDSQDSQTSTAPAAPQNPKNRPKTPQDSANPIPPNFIKMGTLSKAYGSYGAFVLSSRHIADYLATRAKPLIYSTALSQFDTALALVNLDYIAKHKAKLRRKIKRNQRLAFEILGVKIPALILSLQFARQSDMIDRAKMLENQGFLVGAIRRPSANLPTLRVILSAKHKKRDIKKICESLR